MTLAHRSHGLVHCLLSVMLVVATAAVPTIARSTTSPSAERPGASYRPVNCEPATIGHDKLTVVCALDAAAPQRIHIKVHLTGSHDDTTASMEVAIGATPVVCDAGSKTSTEGEDGDVTLECRITAPGGQGAATILRASAKWFHAQYVGLEVDGRRP